MIEELDRIVQFLARQERVTPALLQPGLSTVDTRAWEARLPFLLPLELEQLYRWHDGTRVDEGVQLDSVYFFPGFYLLSLEEAVETFMERRDAPQWQEGWFPVFADGGGDFYLASCTNEKKETAEIIGFIHGEPQQPVEYESLTAMIKTIDACYAEGAFFIAEDNTLEIDDDLHREVARRLNPEIPEWRS